MPDAPLLVLAGITVVFVALVAGAATLSSRRHRAQATRSLSAIDFVRRGFAARVGRGEDLEKLLQEVVEALRDSFGLDGAEIWLADAGGGLERRFADPPAAPSQRRLSAAEETVIASSPVSGSAWLAMWLPELLPADAGPALRAAPVTHQATLLGLVLVRRGRDPQRLPADVDETLAELAREVGTAVQTARLDSALARSLADLRRHAAELQASRARLVAAADAERRRIERNLHDGAQQELLGLAMKASLIRALLDRDPQAAREALDELAAEISRAIDSLRSLAHGIYPPLLADKGLTRALVTACRRSSVAAELDEEGIGRYPAAIEAAVYFCCLEALQNTGKHAGEGASARVRLRADADSLVFEVVDDGHGFDPEAAVGGTGLTGMQDRIGALGGVIEVTSWPSGGTRLVGRVPLPK